MIVLVIAIILIVVALIAGIVCLFIDPHNSIFTFAMSWEYRALLELRMWYLDGKRRNPPTSYDFFLSRVEQYVNSKNRPYTERQDICNMLSREEFVNYYFSEKFPLSGKLYHQMFQDYRSGDYLTKNYDADSELKRNLPSEISLIEDAFADFKKFVDEGWFDNRTGIPTGKVDKQHCGRAIYWICKRNGIPNPAKLFAPVWGEKESTVHERIRINKNNEEITKAIDALIDSILRK